MQSARQHLFRIAMLSLCIGSNPLTLKRPIGIEGRGEGKGCGENGEEERGEW